MQRKSKEELLSMLTSENKQHYENALKYIHASMFKTIQQLILKKGGTKEIAEDIFWEGMMEVDRWVKQKKFADDSNVEGFLRTVCERMWYKMLNQDKQLSHQPLPLDMERYFVNDEFSTTMLPEKLRGVLDELIKKLGENCKEKLSLYFYRGLSHQEIADKLNLASRGVVTNAISRCIKRLKEEVEIAGGWELFTN